VESRNEKQHEVIPYRIRDRWQAAMAMGFLSVVSLVLLFGSGRLVTMLRAWPVRRSHTVADPGVTADEATLAVNRACRYFPFPVACLQSAAATVCYLRWRGHAANLVIGVKKMPFAAHAWAELGGVVVNDRTSVRDDFTVIDDVTAAGRN
jgi:hypothetical protein